MSNGNLTGLIIAMLSLAITVVLTMRHVKENGFRLEIIVQPAPSYVAPSRERDQQRGSQLPREKQAKIVTVLNR
jgi:hypothetical protein